MPPFSPTAERDDNPKIVDLDELLRRAGPDYQQGQDQNYVMADRPSFWLDWLGPRLRNCVLRPDAFSVEARKRPESAREDRSALNEASAFLLDILAMGPRPSKEVQAEAKARGIAWATLRRSMPKAGVQKQKVGFQGRWVPSLKTCSENHKDAQDFVVSTFAQMACMANESPHRAGEVPAKEAQRAAPDLSEAHRAPARSDPDAGLVPPGFTIPPGVKCVCWGLKSAPLKLDRGVTVLNAEDFVKGHLDILAAKLRGYKGWLYEQWPAATLLDDLRDAGIELRISE